MKNIKGVERALSRLAHGRIFDAHHLDLFERGEVGAQEDEEVNDTEEAGIEASQRSVEQREARIRAANVLSCAGGSSMDWLDHTGNYATAKLTPEEYRGAFRFTFDIPEMGL